MGFKTPLPSGSLQRPGRKLRVGQIALTLAGLVPILKLAVVPRRDGDAVACHDSGGARHLLPAPPRSPVLRSLRKSRLCCVVGTWGA